ncbi:iron-sulfur cluster assembly accessory protein [Ceratobasidium sp. AG-Ba]|nr:iron-sulfur cluster assembly accessory protein [Ceratobasidium sp. AG-Ba]QRW15473.1 iron-sulfur cluster assembly accessory protein [Ceratobasidium sp. AG-Ba]
MYSRVAAGYARFTSPQSFYNTTRLNRIIGVTRVSPRPPQTSPLRNSRYLSTSLVVRARAVLAHAPTQADLEATEEFSETEIIPREEASLNITDAAAEQLRNISMRENDENIALRVLVESGGCHGYQYKLELTSERQPSDYHFVRPPTTPGRVGVVIDPISLPLLKVRRIQCDKGDLTSEIRARLLTLRLN